MVLSLYSAMTIHFNPSRCVGYCRRAERMCFLVRYMSDGEWGTMSKVASIPSKNAVTGSIPVSSTEE